MIRALKRKKNKKCMSKSRLKKTRTLNKQILMPIIRYQPTNSENQSNHLIFSTTTM